MKEIIWEPYGEYLEKSNIKRFMDKHGIKNYEELIRRSNNDIEWFWNAMMEDCNVEWFRKYDRILDLGQSRSFEWAKWFIGGKINIAHNSLDCHAKDPLSKNRLAFVWEGEDGSIQKWTYWDLYTESNRCANALPKTRSAKIVRGIIKKKYLGEDIGDISSVENPDAIEEIGKAV